MTPTAQDGEGLDRVPLDERIARAVLMCCCPDPVCTHPVSGLALGDARKMLAIAAPEIAVAARLEALRTATAESAQVVAILGPALGYAPDGTGDHTAVTLAEETAPLVRYGRQLRDMLTDARARQEEPAGPDQSAAIRARRDGLLAEIEARVRRECAETVLGYAEAVGRSNVYDEPTLANVERDLRGVAAEWSGSGSTPTDEQREQ